MSRSKQANINYSVYLKQEKEIEPTTDSEQPINQQEHAGGPKEVCCWGPGPWVAWQEQEP